MPKSCGYLLGYNGVCGAERQLVRGTVISRFTLPPAGWTWKELNFVSWIDNLTYEFKERRKVFTISTVHITLRNSALYEKLTNKEIGLFTSAAFLATHSPVLSVSFENVGRTTEVQSSCKSCDWCPRSVHRGAPVRDGSPKHSPGLLFCIQSTLEQGVCVAHTFADVSLKKTNRFLLKQNILRENKDRLPINIVTQKSLNCDPGFQELVWSWVV